MNPASLSPEAELSTLRSLQFINKELPDWRSIEISMGRRLEQVKAATVVPLDWWCEEKVGRRKKNRRPTGPGAGRVQPVADTEAGRGPSCASGAWGISPVSFPYSPTGRAQNTCWEHWRRWEADQSPGLCSLPPAVPLGGLNLRVGNIAEDGGKLTSLT